MEYAAKMRKVKKALAPCSKETFRDVFKWVVDLEAQVQMKEAQLEIFPTPESQEELNRVTTELKRYYLF